MKKTLVTVCSLIAATLSLLVISSPASAASIGFSTTGGPVHIFFEGTANSITVQYAGSASFVIFPPFQNPLELENGIPTDVLINKANFTTGVWPGISLSETQSLTQTITIGSVSAQLVQDVKVDWIANNQAMFTFLASDPVSLDLGSIGILDITLSGTRFQARENSTGGGTLLIATFLLTVSVESILESLIEDVMALDREGVINGGQTNSLIKQLEQIINRLDNEEINAACDVLTDFINHVIGFIEDEVLTQEQGQPLIDGATNARSLLDC